MYAVVRWTGLRRDWVEFVLLVATVVGIGAVVARAGGDRPFLKAAVVSSMTALSIGSLELTTSRAWERPEVLPSTATVILILIVLSLMIGAMAGAVALGVRSLQATTDGGRELIC